MDRAWAGSPGDGERLEPCRDLSINSQRDISQRVHGQRFVIGVNCGGRGFNEVESNRPRIQRVLPLLLF